MLAKNDKAIDFTLKGIDMHGEEIEFTLSEHFGKTMVLFFYPQDDTPICTMEANDFSDIAENIAPYADIIGISRDDVATHKHFQDKYDLKVMLLSDPDSMVHEKYGVIQATDQEHKAMVRSTFLVGQDGTIAAMWKNVDVEGHVEEVMTTIKNCKFE